MELNNQFRAIIGWRVDQGGDLVSLHQFSRIWNQDITKGSVFLDVMVQPERLQLSRQWVRPLLLNSNRSASSPMSAVRLYLPHMLCAVNYCQSL